jgi:hypothetical protein
LKIATVAVDAIAFQNSAKTQRKTTVHPEESGIVPLA